MEPLVTFFRVLPAGSPWRQPDHGKPRRARPEGTGMMPFRQAQYCEPSRQATQLGYYIFLPMSFSVRWHGGHEYDVSFDDEVTWYHLTEVAFPGSFAAWDAVAPENCKGYCPNFISTTTEEGMLQIWPGWFAKTRPGYSLWVMPPVNVGTSPMTHVLHGSIDTDHWFGPLFTNVRLTATGRNIKFDAQRAPFMQVVPIDRSSLGSKLLDDFAVRDGIPEELWPAYYETLIRRHVHQGEPGFDRAGHYAVQARRRAKQDE